MFATDFTERLMPFDPALRPRLGALRDKVLLGSDFPCIPYPYAHQLAALHRLELGEEWLRAVLWENGARCSVCESVQPHADRHHIGWGDPSGGRPTVSAATVDMLACAPRQGSGS